MRDLVPWTLREDFESKIKENKKVFVSIASNLTRLEIETDRYLKNRSISHFFLPFSRRQKAT